MSVHFATYLHFLSRESCSVIKPHALNQSNLFPDGAGFHLPIIPFIRRNLPCACGTPEIKRGRMGVCPSGPGGNGVLL
jgi:hypothetical protein